MILFLSISSLLTQSGIGKFMVRVNCLIFSQFMLTSFASGTHSGIGKTYISSSESFDYGIAAYFGKLYESFIAGDA